MKKILISMSYICLLILFSGVFQTVEAYENCSNYKSRYEDLNNQTSNKLKQWTSSSYSDPNYNEYRSEYYTIASQRDSANSEYNQCLHRVSQQESEANILFDH